MRTLTKMCAPVFLVGLCVQSQALAQAEHGSANPVQVDPWQAGFAIAVFVLLLIILSSFAFKPILGALQKREDFIRDSLEQAKKDRESAEQRLKDYEQKLNEARAEATAIVDEGRRDAEVVRKKIADEAEKDATAMVERAKREIGIATETAVKEVFAMSARLATDAASRIIRKELNPADHERLVAESIEELDKLSLN
ncbi:MAG: F0F1 ATP synthase subunit B [Planctomycetes bacterium]|nr:F0F1 ATP synthase subunit B [Planctomycetota bacterium]